VGATEAFTIEVSTLRTALKLSSTLIFLITMAVGLPAPAAAQMNVLYNFNGVSDGCNLGDQTLTQGRDGKLYGSTVTGNVYRRGTVFQIGTDGTYHLVHVMGGPTGGYLAWTGVILGTDGFLYGDTQYTTAPKPTGLGILYKVSSGGSFATLANLTGTQVGYPLSQLVETPSHFFYGTSAGGNSAAHAGAVFQLNSAGTVTILHSFDSLDGFMPGNEPLAVGPDGALYGTTLDFGEGTNASGTAYRLTQTGQFTLLYTFIVPVNTSANPQGLIAAEDGNFYGTTQGSIGLDGTVYRMTSAGVLTTLHTFTGGTDGNSPTWTLAPGADGRLYGVTQFGGANGTGVVFSVGTDGSFQVEYNFPNGAGEYAEAGLIQHTNGLFYGTMQGTNGCGSIYSLDFGFGPFVKTVLNAGKVGSQAEILGQGLTGTTSVTFNGVPATFTVVSDTYLTATVPSGATTGPIQITTPTGVLNSNKSFDVLP
jgi:uncharacterized repeat protein (TIGR03803 family)